MKLVELAALVDTPIKLTCFDVNGKITASLADVRIAENGLLIGACGRGDTTELAMADYARRVSGKKIAVGFGSAKEFAVPTVTHP